MIDAMDVNVAVAHYRDFVYKSEVKYRRAYIDDDTIHMPVPPEFDPGDWRTSDLDMEELKSIQEQDGNWNVPCIEEKMMVPPKVKQRYEEAKEQCQKCVSELQDRLHRDEIWAKEIKDRRHRERAAEGMPAATNGMEQ